MMKENECFDIILSICMCYVIDREVLNIRRYIFHPTSKRETVGTTSVYINFLLLFYPKSILWIRRLSSNLDSNFAYFCSFESIVKDVIFKYRFSDTTTSTSLRNEGGLLHDYINSDGKNWLLNQNITTRLHIFINFSST